MQECPHCFLFKMIKPTNAAIAATPSPPARPIATPKAKIIGRHQI